MAMFLPRGSILYIEAKDLLATPAGTVKIWNKITEHNRSALELNTERIEKKTEERLFAVYSTMRVQIHAVCSRS